MVLGRDGSLDQLQGRDAAGVDDALDAGAQRLHHDVPRSLDIIADDLLRVSRPEAIVGRRVKEEPDALQRRRQRGAIEEVALAHCVARIEICARARWTHQCLDVVPAGAQRRGDRRSDKAAGAGHKHARRGRRLGRALGRRSGCPRVVRRSAVGRSDTTLSTFAITHDCVRRIRVFAFFCYRRAERALIDQFT